MSARARRDLRIDLLRGSALLFILWDHIMLVPEAANPFFLMVTPALWGVSSALAIFVFLSGYVYGVVYRRLMKRNGTSFVFKKSYDRAWQLYVFNLLTMIVSAGVVGGFSLLLDREISTIYYRADGLFHSSPEVAWHILTLQYFPGLLGVLPLYLVILLLSPIYLVWLRRGDWGLWGATTTSVGLYAMAQYGLNLPAPMMTGSGGFWPFNPFAWQLLFFIGITLGWRKPPLLCKRWARAAAVVVGLSILKIWLLPRLARSGIPMPEWLIAPIPWSEKGSLGPVRLAYFLTLAYATAHYTQFWGARLRTKGWGARLLRVSLVKPGQYSLTVYTAGIVLTFVAIILLGQVEPHWLYTTGAIAGAWGLSIGVAYLAEARRTLSSKPSRAACLSPANSTPSPGARGLANASTECPLRPPEGSRPGDAPNLPQGTGEEAGRTRGPASYVLKP